MIKMPCLFQGVFEGRSRAALLEDVTPGCEWVLADRSGNPKVRRDRLRRYQR